VLYVLGTQPKVCRSFRTVPSTETDIGTLELTVTVAVQVEVVGMLVVVAGELAAERIIIGGQTWIACSAKPIAPP